jgi:hypothetical protein
MKYKAEVNTGYLYHDSDINDLTLLYEKDHPNINNIMWSSACGTKEMDLYDIPKKIENLEVGQKLLIPFNTGGHWIGIQIEKTDLNKANFTALNSLNADQNTFSESDKTWYAYFQAKLENTKLTQTLPTAIVWKQKDSTSCGAWAVENLCREGYQEDLGVVQTLAINDIAVREHHIALLENQDFLGKQTENIAYTKAAAQKRDEAKAKTSDIDYIYANVSSKNRRNLNSAIKAASSKEGKLVAMENFASSSPSISEDEKRAIMVVCKDIKNKNAVEQFSNQLNQLCDPQKPIRRGFAFYLQKAKEEIASSFVNPYKIETKKVIDSNAQISKNQYFELTTKELVSDIKLSPPEFKDALENFITTAKLIPEEKEAYWGQLNQNFAHIPKTKKLLNDMGSQGFDYGNIESVESLYKYAITTEEHNGVLSKATKEPKNMIQQKLTSMMRKFEEEAIEAPTKLLALQISKEATPEFKRDLKKLCETSKENIKESWNAMAEKYKENHLMKEMNSQGFNDYNPDSIKKLNECVLSYEKETDIIIADQKLARVSEKQANILNSIVKNTKDIRRPSTPKVSNNKGYRSF